MYFYHKNPQHPSGCRRTRMGEQGSLVYGLKLLFFPTLSDLLWKIPPRNFASSQGLWQKTITIPVPQSVRFHRVSKGLWRKMCSMKMRRRLMTQPEPAASENSSPQCQLLNCSWKILLCNWKLSVREDLSIMRSLLTTIEVMDQTLHHFLLCCWSSFMSELSLPCLFPLS